MDKQQLLARIRATLNDLSSELNAVIEINVFKTGDQGRQSLTAKLRDDRGDAVSMLIEVCANPRMVPVQKAAREAQQAAVRRKAIPVVGGTRLGARIRQWLREQGVGYIDLHGHAYLRGPGLLVDRHRQDPNGPVDLDSPGSPFADRSSLVPRHLIADAPLEFRVRDLAAHLGISPALVSRIVNRLKQDGYISMDNSNGLTVQSVDLLLQDWVEFYRRRAMRQREKQFYLHARDANALMLIVAERMAKQPPLNWAFSYQAGASLVSPFAFFSEVHMLISSNHWDEIVNDIAVQLGAKPAETEVNLVLVDPFYRNSWAYGCRKISGLPVVSDIQLFLDLSRYPRRGAEQAARIMERITHVTEPTEGN